MSKIVYFPDNDNFKNRNFPQLHRLCRDFGLRSFFDKIPHQPGSFVPKMYQRKYHVNNVKEYRYLYNIDLYDIIQANYQKYINTKSLNEHFDFTWKDIINERLDALDNGAINELINQLIYAQTCIEYYRDTLFERRPMLVFVFGGSQIYQRACLKICELYNLNTFVIENFFTGKQQYFEPQFNQIQNNKHTIKRVYARAKKAPRQMKPINLSISNINVQNQPNTQLVDEIFYSMTTEKIGCVILQVFDDYSLANISNDFVLARELDRIITLALEDNDRILLKLHPWEIIKHPSYPTKSYLKNRFSEEIKLGRVYLVEGIRDDQISRIDSWYGIVSQYALNLVLLGKDTKLNDAFFFNELLGSCDTNEKALLIHEISEHGLFNKTRGSYEKLIDHLAENLLPSIGCREADIEEFFDKSCQVKNSVKVFRTQITNTRGTTKIKTIAIKIKNAFRLLLTDPRSFKVKLLAKLRM